VQEGGPFTTTTTPSSPAHPQGSLLDARQVSPEVHTPSPKLHEAIQAAAGQQQQQRPAKSLRIKLKPRPPPSSSQPAAAPEQTGQADQAATRQAATRQAATRQAATQQERAPPQLRAEGKSMKRKARRQGSEDSVGTPGFEKPKPSLKFKISRPKQV